MQDLICKINIYNQKNSTDSRVESGESDERTGSSGSVRVPGEEDGRDHQRSAEHEFGAAQKRVAADETMQGEGQGRRRKPDARQSRE